MTTSGPPSRPIPRPETEASARELARKLRLLRVAAWIGVLSSAIYGVAYLTNARQLWLGTVVCAMTACAHGVVLRLAERRQKLSIGLFLVACNAQIAVVTWLVGPGPYFHAYYFAFVASVFLVTPRAWPSLYTMAAVSCGLLLAADLTLRPEDAVAPFPPMVETSLRAFTIVLVCASLAYIVARFDADTRVAELAQEREHARSERLLLNILPVDIAERLKSDQANIADRHDDVTVLFADLAGFTDLSERTPPDELVAMLSEVFATFDELADQCGLEKIKTIGDAYMAAAGMRSQPADAAAAAARMGLAMIEAVKALNERRGWKLAIRVGLHSGPAVAGVIGKSKFAYDLWGDTVNTASRMESHGVAGRVHASAVTAAKLGARFVLEGRGVIAVKGKGELETWFVDAELDDRASPSSRAAAALAHAGSMGRPAV